MVVLLAIHSEISALYKGAIIVLALAVIALLAYYPLGLGAGTGDRSKAEENVRELYKVVSGGAVEVIKTVEQNGLQKVTVRFRDVTGRDILADVFVTRDGEFFTDRLIDLRLQKSSLANQSAFADCLFNKQLRVFGLSSDQGTQAQLQALGAFSGRIYVDCGGQNLAICQQINITQVPVIFFNKNLVQGPQARGWFEQNVQCYMTADGNAPPAG
ncbi:MAG: hypothetical protein HYX24_07725 [Candidatus Aenigmarchaeota archaeon]|nr:hypothetical protein [Candidatus Aenigmarchaeota archaeon]